MAGVRVTIPGTAGIVEGKKAALAAAVRHQWNVVTATPEAPQAMPLWKRPDEAKTQPRRASAGDLGKRLQTLRLA